jgi:hypothetical protein
VGALRRNRIINENDLRVRELRSFIAIGVAIRSATGLQELEVA